MEGAQWRDSVLHSDLGLLSADVLRCETWKCPSAANAGERRFLSAAGVFLSNVFQVKSVGALTACDIHVLH